MPSKRGKSTQCDDIMRVTVKQVSNLGLSRPMQISLPKAAFEIIPGPDETAPRSLLIRCAEFDLKRDSVLRHALRVMR